MGEKTAIEWTDHTMNPWRGCTKVSPGCANCYAERGSVRNPKVLGIWGDQGTRVLASDSHWAEAEKWDREARKEGRKARVFCASLADVFEDWEGQMSNSHGKPALTCGGIHCTLAHARERLWQTIRATPNLIWQILTKRPDNVRKMLPAGDWPNVWLGTSVESQEYTPRLDMLQDAIYGHCKVPILFCSAEPLLGPINFGNALEAFKWVIVGGESGGKARSLDLGWVRDILFQCRQHESACFIKQLGHEAYWYGARSFEQTAGLQILRSSHSKGGDWTEWPADLRVRDFPPED